MGTEPQNVPVGICPLLTIILFNKVVKSFRLNPQAAAFNNSVTLGKLLTSLGLSSLICKMGANSWRTRVINTSKMLKMFLVNGKYSLSSSH